MSDCQCKLTPDSVDRTNWKCNLCGSDVKVSFEAKQKSSAEFYKNQDKYESEARSVATEAYNKVFKDYIATKDVSI